MTGESPRDEHDDFLDDDFVIEDIAPKNEDLDQLFEMPADADKGPATTAADAEDMLFEAPAIETPSETFASGGEFGESADAGWNGEMLDLEAEASGEAAEPVSSEAMAEAEASFTKELDSLLQSDEDFALDSEQELEVIGAAGGDADVGDGVSEFEQSGPFVLDDGDGVWQEQEEAAEVPIADEVQLSGVFSTADEEAVGAEFDAAEVEDAEVAEVDMSLHGSDAQDAHEPGWEPLPTTSVDDLSEVDEVERADTDADHDPVYGEQPDEAYAEAADGELVGAALAADVDGHDLYVEDEPAAAVLGAPVRRGRTLRVLTSLAATLAVLSSAAAIVLRPEWFGLRLAPEKVEQAQVTRPRIAVDVPQPAALTPPPVAVQPVEPEPPAVVVEEPPPVEVPTPVAVEPTPVEPLPVGPAPSEPTPVEPAPVDPVAGAPDGQQPTPTEPPAVVEAPTGTLPGWPAEQATPATPTDPVASASRPRLVRVGEELLIGDDATLAPRETVAGVSPGSRAFAQLQNGNYFIGNVKRADSQRVTLRIESGGEVTIPVAAIARITELGSTDYEELQRATSGFVRLTNNNRLVGGILSGIADDHIVLEFRKNRVMLPKSLIGQVVQGEEDAEIRLDTTREEDDWLRRLIERQLGTGTGADTPAAPQGTQPPR